MRFTYGIIIYFQQHISTLSALFVCVTIKALFREPLCDFSNLRLYSALCQHSALAYVRMCLSMLSDDFNPETSYSVQDVVARGAAINWLPFTSFDWCFHLSITTFRQQFHNYNDADRILRFFIVIFSALKRSDCNYGVHIIIFDRFIDIIASWLILASILSGKLIVYHVFSFVAISIWSKSLFFFQHKYFRIAETCTAKRNQ